MGAEAHASWSKLRQECRLDLHFRRGEQCAGQARRVRSNFSSVLSLQLKMNRNQYKLPARGTGVGSQYSMADSMRGSTFSADGDAPPVLPPKATHDSGGRMTVDSVHPHPCLILSRAQDYDCADSY